jgi:hypothetical protein
MHATYQLQSKNHDPTWRQPRGPKAVQQPAVGTSQLRIAGQPAPLAPHLIGFRLPRAPLVSESSLPIRAVPEAERTGDSSALMAVLSMPRRVAEDQRRRPANNGVQAKNALMLDWSLFVVSAKIRLLAIDRENAIVFWDYEFH